MRSAQVKTATVPDQRGNVLMRTRIDLADEQHVVAGRMQRVVSAFQPGNAALDSRCRSRTQVKRHAVEPIGVRTRKTARQLDLIMGEDVDNITLSALEHRQAS